MTEVAIITPIQDISNSLELMTEGFRSVLPAAVAPDKFIRVVKTAIQNSPGLVNADKSSLLSAAMKCAEDGLLPDGREAALVIFGGRAVYMPMVGGILKKIRNSGELVSINAQVVYENDLFSYYTDEKGEHLRHEPNFTTERGDPKITYAIAQTKDDGVYIEVMSEKQIQDVKSASRAKGSGPWASQFADEMRRKTAIRRLAKRLPMSTDAERVLHADDDEYDMKSYGDIKSPELEPTRLSALLGDA